LVSKEKISFLGLDGLPPSLLIKATKKLNLKNLKYLISKGKLFPLYSMPPITPVAWTSIATGVNPAKHGIWGFTKYYKGKMGEDYSRPYVSSDIMFPRVFEDMAYKGLEVTLINYPLTWPIKSICCKDKMHIIGDTFLGPEVEFFPNSLIQDFKEYFKTPSEINDPYQRTIMLIEGSIKAINSIESDAYFIVLPFPDQAFHKYPYEVLNVKEKSAKVWYEIDNLASELIKKTNKFVLVSDHGVGTYKTCVNILPPLMNEFHVYLPKTFKGKILFSLKNMLDEISLILPPRLSPRQLLTKDFAKNIIENLSKEIFKHGSKPGTLNDNLLTLSKPGTLNDSPFTYDDHGGLSMARIIYFKNEDFREKGLKSLVGDKISNYIKIYKLEERFKGKYLPDYPSLFLESIDHEKYHIIVSKSLVRLMHDPYPDHKVIGTMLIFGEDIIKNNANLYDVTPTLLSLVGLPIPKEADSDGVVNKKGEFPYNIAIKMKSLMKS